MEHLTDYQRAAKIRRINQQLSACKLTPNRPDVLALWGAVSFDGMTDANLEACQAFLSDAYRCKTTPATEPVRRLRSQVMTLLNKLGKYAEPKDWTEVNSFLLQRKICGRLLYMLNVDELDALIRKLRAIKDKKNDPATVTHQSPRSVENQPDWLVIEDAAGPQPSPERFDQLLTGLLPLLNTPSGPAN